MEKEDTVHTKDKTDWKRWLQLDLAKQISNATGLPIFVADGDKIKELLECIKRVPDITKLYSDLDLHKEVSNFYIEFNMFPPKDQKEVDDRIRKFVNSLITQKEYTAYIILRGISGYPIGLKLGNVEFIKPDLTKSELVKHIEYLNKNGNLRLEKPEDWNWIKVKFTDYRTLYSSDALFSELELAYSIISLFSDKDLDTKDNLGVIYSPDIIARLSPKTPQNGWSKLCVDLFLITLKRLSIISNKEGKTKLEKKILNSLKTYGLSRSSTRIETQFLMLVASCEALLLTKNDKDYLNLKLSEKTAFLLLRKGIERKDLYNKMRYFYKMRSDLIHEGEAKISPDDFNYLKAIYLESIIKLVKLSKKYTQMEKSNNKNKIGIEDYIECLKFGVRLSSVNN